MALIGWLGSRSVVSQAKAQWQAVDTWLAAGQQNAASGMPESLKRFGLWLLATLWRIAIGTALAVSLLIEAFAALFRPLFLLIDSLIGWLLLPLTAPIEAVLSVPYAGRAVGWVWRSILSLWWGLLTVMEAPLVLLSVMPTRRLRLWVLPTGMKDPAEGFHLEDWLQSIELTSKILKREANVQLVPVIPWESEAGLFRSESSGSHYPWIREIQLAWADNRLNVACNLEALKEDLGPLGGQFDRMALLGHPRGSYRRLIGWGSPIMAVAVSSVAGGELAGCSLGPLANYVTVRADMPLCLAHELGHACNLPHNEAADNLMNPTCGGVHLNRWQVLLLRCSRHTTFL